MPTRDIKVKVMCLFVKDGKTLLQSGSSMEGMGLENNRAIIKKDGYRLLGGSIEEFEKADDAVRREIREELGSEIENVKFLKVVEHFYEVSGEKGHEIVFLYKADLVNKELYAKEKIHVVESDYQFDAEWIPVEKVLKKEIKVYPVAEYEEYLK